MVGVDHFLPWLVSQWPTGGHFDEGNWSYPHQNGRCQLSTKNLCNQFMIWKRLFWDGIANGKLKLPSSLKNVQLPSSEKRNQIELPSLPNRVTLIITLPQNLKFCEKDTLLHKPKYRYLLCTTLSSFIPRIPSQNDLFHIINWLQSFLVESWQRPFWWG